MYRYVQRDPDSSVYAAVSAVLDENEWIRCRRESPRFHLMLGDLNRLPWHTLGQTGVKPLVNYYRGARLICRKAQLTRTLNNYRSRMGRPPVPWYPESYVVSPRQNAKSTKRPPIIASTDDRDRLREAVTGRRDSVWIVKSSCGAKGLGMLITDSVEKAIDFVDSQGQLHVVQKYIENPLLLDGDRKFDIRVWVLLDHEFRVFMYKEGVLRTTSEPYRPDDLQATTSHLTNHYLQENFSQNYGLYEEGNEMFFDEFAAFLHRKHGKRLHDVLSQIRSIVLETFKSVREDLILAETASYRSFQLFGFDFMLDTSFKVWLMEVNGSPASAERLLPAMAQSIVQTAIDPLFPPAEEASQSTLFEPID
ncbi:tubulin--tyrosine ligase-like [Oscarella lobularis]|uniref:tubulin--tyrosine ligase-like n=1 Tax=Oscarella lobularis TaxID=121494 RepID=UPI003313ABFA